MLRTHESLHNAPPTGRRGLLGCSLPAICRHGRLCVDVILFFAPTDGSADRGDLVERGKIKWGLSVCSYRGEDDSSTTYGGPPSLTREGYEG